MEPLYRHPADEQPALRPWTPVVEQIRRAVERRVSTCAIYASLNEAP